MGGESRIGKLDSWLEFWNRSKVLWSAAYAPSGLTEVNLAEQHQSAFSKKNQLTDLDLWSGVVFEIGVFLKSTERQHLLSRGKYQGQGPSKYELNMRNMEKNIKRVLNTPFTTEDLRKQFLEMGIPHLTSQNIEKNKEKNTEPGLSPIVNADILYRSMLDKYVSDPNSSHTYKTKSPKIGQTINLSLGAKKVGRPKGSKSRKTLVYFDETYDSESDITDTIVDDDWINDISNRNKIIMKDYPDPSDNFSEANQDTSNSHVEETYNKETDCSDIDEMSFEA